MDAISFVRDGGVYVAPRSAAPASSHAPTGPSEDPLSR